MPKEKPSVITIDPSLQYERMLHYKEKHSGWIIYNSVYWGIYLFAIGILLVSGTVTSVAGFFGWALMLLAIFVIVHGFTSSLHLKLMKHHG